MASRLTVEQNKLIVRLIGLRSNHSYDHKTSASFFCPKPNHRKDTAPSFNVNFEEGIYHCFGCGASGTIRSLCWEMQKKSPENLLGLSLSDFRLSQPVNYKPFSLADKIKGDEEYEMKADLSIRGAVQPYYRSPDTLEYLETRGIARREADAMEMKYVDEAYCNGTYFKNRLLIPVYNANRGMMNVEARDITRLQPVKCLYPKGTIKTIYEHWKLDKTKPLFIVEGLMDLAVLRSDDFFANSSAIFGVQVTEYQYTLLNKFSEVILIPDNDDAGDQSVKTLRSRLKTKFSVWKIGPTFIKDVGDIPRSRTNVKEFREAGNFIISH